ncbi:VOC family protein [Hamadaea tsunoensis]|uniref:VOC family protein n=1 Tax=Hamadaea tsunoensis TaxID=53368 RepID=UPI00040600CC|nr:VOC family protein [Hamadaea tsunoensis]
MTDVLSRRAASDAVAGIGWRYMLGRLHTAVPVKSLAEAAAAAPVAIEAAGPTVLGIDLRADRALITLGDWAVGVTTAETEAAARITTALARLGLTTEGVGDPRGVQELEIAIDALDIEAVRPFWAAALAYVPHPAGDGSLADPFGQGPPVWFQQMDAPRPQRNRIHFDINVPHDEAAERMAAIEAAGGTLVYGDEAPLFWVYADPEGNEVCICTWQGRDAVSPLPGARQDQ